MSELNRVQAAHLLETSRILVPELNPAINPYDLVLEIGNDERYLGRPLGDRPSLDEGSPRHWFLVLPHPEVEHAILPVEFGLTNKDLTGHDHVEARFDHELFIDQTINMNRDNIAVQKLFGLIGGFMVEKVRVSGDSIVAGLEVRYKFIEDELYMWNHLLYSRTLRATQQRLRESTRNVAKPPLWVRDSLKPNKQLVLAENMAISALTAARS